MSQRVDGTDVDDTFSLSAAEHYLSKCTLVPRILEVGTDAVHLAVHLESLACGVINVFKHSVQLSDLSDKFDVHEIMAMAWSSGLSERVLEYIRQQLPHETDDDLHKADALLEDAIAAADTLGASECKSELRAVQEVVHDVDEVLYHNNVLHV